MGYLTRAYTINSDVRYGYDELSRLKTVSVVKRDGVAVNPSEVTTNNYTRLGSLQNVYFPNGTWTVYQYDVMNHLTNEVHYNGANQLLAQYQYTVASDGTRLASTETRQESGGTYSTTQIAWTNDALHRLVREASSSTVPALNFTNSYVYDLAGNRLWKTNFSNTGTQVTSCSYNANDQLLVESTGSTSFTNSYDANGSVTNHSSASEQNVYSYNLEGRLATAAINQQQTNKYFYNQSGIRVQEEMSGTVSGTNIFLNDPQNLSGFSQVLEELPSIGATPTVTYTLGSQVIGQEKSGVISYLMPDGHGSTRLLTGSSGTITDRYSYDAYGNGLDFTATMLNPPTTRLLYTGEQFDLGLQQYYLRARYYNPTVGRFGMQDPVDGTPDDPLNLHKYVYCQNNPVNMHDPSGNQGDIGGMMMSMSIENILDTIEVVHAVWMVGSLITESVVANESLDQIESQNAKPGVDTATIIVHGVANHKNGWSKSDETPFQQDLGNDASRTPMPVDPHSQPLNHDFYEFDWGGFSVGGIPWTIIPIRSVHQMALIHLQIAEELVSMKGYANIDIISHSWGTTLTYDLQQTSGIETHRWVTMGSVLKESTPKPARLTGDWINFSSPDDPAYTRGFYPPFPDSIFELLLEGPNVHSDKNVNVPHVFSMNKSGIDEHGAYWNNYDVLSYLRKELQ
jgi:RHS repeat-associated protein